MAPWNRRFSQHELAADLTAETLATALRARGRFEDRGGDASAWLFRIARNKLVDSVRRGRAEDRAQRLLGMQRIVPDAVDLEAIARLGDDGAVASLVEELPAISAAPSWRRSWKTGPIRISRASSRSPRRSCASASAAASPRSAPGS